MARSWLVLVLFVSPLLADEKPKVAADLLTTQKGDLPIIISAPHGGRKAIPDCPERKGKGVPMFTNVNDVNTDELTKRILAAIEKKLKAKPYGVIAHFERKYADVNRKPEDGVEDDKAKPYYEAYHAFLAESRAAVQKEWGRGILLDIHGHGADPATIFRGTNDGKTVKHLLDRFGTAGLTGENSVLGQLAANGYTVFPANDAKGKENPRFGGGYIVTTYGSKDGGAVDALQLEIGGKMRMRATMDTFAANLADAVAGYAKEYLPEKKVEKKP